MYMYKGCTIKMHHIFIVTVEARMLDLKTQHIPTNIKGTMTRRITLGNPTILDKRSDFRER